MIIFGICAAGDGSRARGIVLPTIAQIARPDDETVIRGGDDLGICSVYNDMIDLARARVDCEALVLLHDDVEILDPNFRPKVLAALRRVDVGIVGVVGGAGLTSAKWWKARRTAGAVYETSGFLDYGDRRSDVDVVDGLMLALGPNAFATLSFDAATYPKFHGYDVDYCLQARRAGLIVCVEPIDLLHRTKGGYGDLDAYDAASRCVESKWRQSLEPYSWFERSARRVRGASRRSRRALGRTRRVAKWSTTHARMLASRRRSRPIAPALEWPDHSPRCPACETSLLPAPALKFERALLCCEMCGSGTTWPPPTREVESEGLWVEMYDGARLTKRPTWMSQALKRVEWIQLYVPEGSLLEIGAGTGEFLKVAEDSGFDAYGVEPSAWARRQAVTLGVRAPSSYLVDWCETYPGFRPDVVAMWHALEHIPDPYATLVDIAALMGGSSRLFLEVPNFASTDAERLGLDWVGAQPDDHFTQFTPEGLTILLTRAGFAVELMLPIPQRIYEPIRPWRQTRNHALLDRHPWPPLDLLRAIARIPSGDGPTARHQPETDRQ